MHRLLWGVQGPSGSPVASRKAGDIFEELARLNPPLGDPLWLRCVWLSPWNAPGEAKPSAPRTTMSHSGGCTSAPDRPQRARGSLPTPTSHLISPSAMAGTGHFLAVGLGPCTCSQCAGGGPARQGQASTTVPSEGRVACCRPASEDSCPAGGQACWIAGLLQGVLT